MCVDSLENKSREAVLRGYEWSWAKDNGVSDPGTPWEHYEGVRSKSLKVEPISYAAD